MLTINEHKKLIQFRNALMLACCHGDRVDHWLSLIGEIVFNTIEFDLMPTNTKYSFAIKEDSIIKITKFMFGIKVPYQTKAVVDEAKINEIMNNNSLFDFKQEENHNYCKFLAHIVNFEEKNTKLLCLAVDVIETAVSVAEWNNNTYLNFDIYLSDNIKVYKQYTEEEINNYINQVSCTQN